MQNKIVSLSRSKPYGVGYHNPICEKHMLMCKEYVKERRAQDNLQKFYDNWIASKSREFASNRDYAESPTFDIIRLIRKYGVKNLMYGERYINCEEFLENDLIIHYYKDYDRLSNSFF